MNAKLEAREPVARYLATPPLLQHFDRVAQAPGGVARLRELILTLAVQGKLLPQDPADEPASVLLERIRAEKARLVKAGKIRKEKPLAAITEEETPFALPVGWEWVRCGEYFQELCTGPFGSVIHKEDYVTGGIPLVNPSHMVDGKIVANTNVSVAPETALRLSAYRLTAGDVVLARRGEMGRFALVSDNEDGWLCGTGSFFIKLHPECNRQYLALQLLDQRFRQDLLGLSVGSTMVNLNQRSLLETLLALPPLAEQSRIVARVEELMALCDALEEKGRLAAAQHERLAGALFDALANSSSAEEAADNWQRIAAHFDLLLDRPAAVDRLEQAILQLAVRGRLVPQNPADEPAGALLQKIRTEKDRLIATGQLKRDKPLPPISDEEKPFELPTGWDFVSVPELCVIGGGATPSKAKPMYWDGDLPWVSPKDMKVNFISDAQDHVSKIALEETRLPLVPKNSLLIVVRGMILAHSFPVGVTQVEVTINQDMKSLTPLVPAITPYLALVCKGFKHDILELVERSSHGTCKLESNKLFAFRFGLPPLAEQSRIVARVAELRALCAQLRDRLATTAQTRSRLAEALLEQAVA